MLISSTNFSFRIKESMAPVIVFFYRLVPDGRKIEQPGKANTKASSG